MNTNSKLLLTDSLFFTFLDSRLRIQHLHFINTFIYRPRSKEIKHVGGIRPSICQSTLSWLNHKTCHWSLPIRGICLCVCNRRACVDNITDVVDRLLTILDGSEGPADHISDSTHDKVTGCEFCPYFRASQP